MELNEAILTCILSSTAAATVVASIKEIILWFLNRKAKLDDNDQAKKDESCDLKKMIDDQSETLKTHQICLEGLEKSISNLEKKLTLTLENDKIILKDKIKYLVLKYSEYGEIILDEKQAIQHMWNIYHYDLKGNGDLDDYMAMLEEIPVVQHHTILRGADTWKG